MRKEFARVFKNKTLILTAFIIPGLLIFLLYTIIGSGLTNTGKKTIVVESAPSTFISILESSNEYNIVVIKNSELEDKIKNPKGWDIVISFEEDFETKVLDSGSPTVKYYYNSEQISSVELSAQITSYLSIYREQLLQIKYGADLIGFNVLDEDVSTGDTSKNMSLLVMSSMLPMLLMTFLFQGCMAFAPESIAGEKERGTINTLLATPVSRTHIALGKIMSLTVLASISSLSSFIGVVLSLPKLIGSGVTLSNVYGAKEYILVLVTLLFTVSLIVGIVSIISAYAKTIQQASTMSLPIMFLSMVLGLSTLITSGSAGNSLLYLIPLYNSSQILYQIFTINVNITQFIITIVSNVVYVVLITFILTKMYNSERIMFRK
jgi:sodium transport system permease protein